MKPLPTKKSFFDTLLSFSVFTPYTVVYANIIGSPGSYDGDRDIATSLFMSRAMLTLTVTSQGEENTNSIKTQKCFIIYSV